MPDQTARHIVSELVRLFSVMGIPRDCSFQPQTQF